MSDESGWEFDVVLDNAGRLSAGAYRGTGGQIRERKGVGRITSTGDIVDWIHIDPAGSEQAQAHIARLRRVIGHLLDDEGFVYAQRTAAAHGAAEALPHLIRDLARSRAIAVAAATAIAQMEDDVARAEDLCANGGEGADLGCWEEAAPLIAELLAAALAHDDPHLLALLDGNAAN